MSIETRVIQPDMDKDIIVRATAAGGFVRCFAATTRDMVEYARGLHNTSPVATAALGRTLTAAAMMGSMQKGEKELLTISIRGDGPMKGLTVTAGADSFVKGYPIVPDVVIPAKENGKLDVSGAIGHGYMTVVKDLGLKEPYVGQTELVSGEIAEDLTYYFANSEQVPSSVGLGVLMNRNNTVRCAGGFILQLMPDAPDYVITQLEANLGMFSSVTTVLDEGASAEDMLRMLTEPLELEILDVIPTGYRCDCSRERVLKAIVSLGRDELAQMAAEKQDIEVKCQFCDSVYRFPPAEIGEILAEKS